ncbi:MAG: methylated-DNA--[protein]-cysteine S-methyltransferase [Lachnospiraceae bacterium]|nr:methylated-DNA--[protein]-cysteine S-methyltransferase [Lachnospiraceae bacterium]
MEYIRYYESPLGRILMSCDGKGLSGLWFVDQKYYAATLSEKYQEKNTAVFDRAREWLDMYFQGQEPDFTPPLTLNTTPFRKRVWEILLTIPYGHTMTYGEIAGRIAAEKGLSHMSAQAVGGAVGHNAISLIIPCHRVVGTDGSLTGYAGGIERKRKLLTLERADMSSFFVPKKGTAL